MNAKYSPSIYSCEQMDQSLTWAAVTNFFHSQLFLLCRRLFILVSKKKSSRSRRCIGTRCKAWIPWTLWNKMNAIKCCFAQISRSNHRWKNSLAGLLLKPRLLEKRSCGAFWQYVHTPCRAREKSTTIPGRHPFYMAIAFFYFCSLNNRSRCYNDGRTLTRTNIIWQMLK